MTIKKLIGQLHLWLGLATGLVVLIIALTGCIYVFRSEIEPLVYKDRLFVAIPENGKRLPISQLKDSAFAVIPPDISLFRIIIPTQPDRSAVFVYQKYNEHAWTYSAYTEFHKTVFVNPYTGEVVKVENTKWEFFNVVYVLHVNLLLGYELGGPIVNWSVYIFVVLLITGLILWWPSNKKEKGYFWFKWKVTTKWKRKNYDLHRIPGFWTLLIALLFALTGLFYSSPSFNTFARWVANGGEHIEEPELSPPDSTVVLSQHPLDLIYHKTDSMARGAQYIMIRPPFRPGFPYGARAYMGDVNYTRHEYYFDQFSTRLVTAIQFESRNRGDKLAVLNYDLHVGTIGGMPTKVLAFLACLIVASLPVTGFYVWWFKKKKSTRVKSESPAKTFQEG